MSTKYIMFNGNSYGEIGKDTGYRSSKNGSQKIRIGDVISFTQKDGDELTGSGMVVESSGDVGVMGYMMLGIKKLGYVQVVIPHDLVTPEIAQRMHGFKLEEKKQLTLQQIEARLGFPIELVQQ